MSRPPLVSAPPRVVTPEVETTAGGLMPRPPLVAAPPRAFAPDAETTDGGTLPPIDVTSPPRPASPVRASPRLLAQASTTADGTSEPSLPSVATTAALLEPVAEPATTLDLEEESQSMRAPEPRKPLTELEPPPGAPPQSRQRRAVPRALGGDGFEGASLVKLPEVKQGPASLADLQVLARKGAWWVLGLFVFAALVAFAVWMFD
jgi:hypothetical protein